MTTRKPNGWAVWLRAALGATLLLLLARCDLTAPVDTRPLVVEAFVQTGEPLSPITLRSTRPLRTAAGDTSAPVVDATVGLELNGQPIAYEADPATPGRYVPRTAATVPPRASFTLTIEWAGRTATARGVTPPAITIDSAQVMVPDEPVEAILVDSLRRDSLDIPAEQGYIYPIDVTVTWTTDFPETGADSTYWMRTQLKPYTSFSSTVVDFFLQPEEVFRERASEGGRAQRRWTGVYAVPVEARTAPLPRHRMRVALVRGTAAYAAFAASRTDPDRREPISNVQGAVGIAAGVALDSVLITVEPTGEAIESAARPARITAPRTSSPDSLHD